MFNLNTLNVSFGVRRREWENFHQHILRWQQNKLSMWRTLSSCRPRDVLLSHSNRFCACIVCLDDEHDRPALHSLHHHLHPGIIPSFCTNINTTEHILNMAKEHFTAIYKDYSVCICLAFPRVVFVFIMYCTLSHMLGHVTSSANGQLYTIKINKDL